MQNEVAGAPEYSLALRPGTQLADEFTVRRVLSASSGHALTYLGESAARQRVVIKEFLPRSLVGRAADGATVRPHTAQDEQQFARTLRRFAREADLLAQISHRHLARVLRVIEANGTAYAVLEHYIAQPIAEVMAERGPLPPREATEVMLQLLDALATLHGEGIVHRDLSPDSVLVDDARGPVLLALTAKRHVVGHGQELMTGYAALEQYGAKDLGPWTDVYASGALLYYLLTGAAPPSPVERASGQMLDSLGGALSEVSPAITRVLMRALALLPDQRPHGARELQRQLEAALASVAGSARAPAARAAQPASAPAAGFDDDRGAALRLAEGGIVVPNEERGGWRGWLTRFTIRRPARDTTDEDAAFLESALSVHAAPPPASVAAPVTRAPAPRVEMPVAPPPAVAPMPAVPPPVATPVPTSMAAEAAVPEAPAAPPVAAPVAAASPRVRPARPTAPVPEPSIAVVPEPAANVARVPEVASMALGPASTESRAALAALQEVLGSEFAVADDEPRSRVGSRSLVTAGVVIILMLTAGITYAARSSSGGPRPKPVRVAQSAGARSAISSAVPDSHLVRAGDTPAAVLQGSSSAHILESAGRLAAAAHDAPVHDAQGVALASRAVDGRDGARPQDHRAPESRSAATPGASGGQPLVPLPATSIDVAVPVTEPQMRFLPPALIPDLRLRLTTGKAYSDQGQYEEARRAFRMALDQLDSALKRYTATDELRNVRRQLEAADAEATQACSAENEMRRTRGGKLLQCQ